MDKQKRAKSSSSSSASLSSMSTEFARSMCLSEQIKAREFWKFIVSQNDLRPCQLPKIEIQNNNDDKVDDEINAASDAKNSFSVSSSSNRKSTGTTPKPRTVMPFKQKSPKENKITSKLDKYLREDLRFADTVDATYEELNAEIDDYQKRLLLCGCKDKKCNCQQIKSNG